MIRCYRDLIALSIHQDTIRSRNIVLNAVLPASGVLVFRRQ
ncbi:hypothetical protein RLEG3_20290 [Rhizobium leguminosarum bv. trifolii WSM1689]|nr:hypothetical protein RLEG3_20290 [Rhizobium leguminosarum bv. trifolii WSM1689]